MLVTHHVDLIIASGICGWAVKLSNGEVEAQGTVDELQATGHLDSHKLSKAAPESAAAEAVITEKGAEGEDKGEPKVARKLVSDEERARSVSRSRAAYP